MSVATLTEIISPNFTENVVIDMLERFSGFKNVQIKNVDIGNSSKKGDSYLSTLCRFSLQADGITNG